MPHRSIEVEYEEVPDNLTKERIENEIEQERYNRIRHAYYISPLGYIQHIDYGYKNTIKSKDELDLQNMLNRGISSPYAAAPISGNNFLKLKQATGKRRHNELANILKRTRKQKALENKARRAERKAELKAAKQKKAANNEQQYNTNQG
jgi:hypothetical protein